jgi:hypothetical protein
MGKGAVMPLSYFRASLATLSEQFYKVRLLRHLEGSARDASFLSGRQALDSAHSTRHVF